MEDFIELYRGKLHPSINKKTDFLITGYVLEDGRKLEEGKKYLKAQ
jgi:hypothetical protein